MLRWVLSIIRFPTILILTCGMLMLASFAEAFRGQLIDRRTGQPIAGAEVAIGGLAGTVRTDQNGQFTWTPDPPPPFVVIVMLSGGRLARPVRIVMRPEPAPHLLQIQIDAAIEDTVVVSGAAPSVDAPPGAATSIVASVDIGRRAPANIMKALENVPGVSGVAEGQSAVPAIRGLARGRTLVLVDGSRLFAERRAGPSVSFLAPDTLDRIDVVRGPASVAYGSDAFGGVIALITRQPALAAPIEGRVSGTMGAGAPQQRADILMSTGLGSRGAVLAEGRYRQADDYASPEGTVPNSSWQDQGGLVRVMARAGGWWSGSWQGDFVGASGLPRADSATLLVSNPFERSKRASVSFDRSGLPWVDHVTVGALVGRYAQRLDQDRLPAPGRPRRIDRSDITGSDVELRVVGRTGVGRGRLTTGVDFKGRRDLEAHDIGIVFNAAGDVTSTTDTASIASARKNDVGAFAEIDVPVASFLSVTAGGRFDQVASVNVGGFFGDRTVSLGAPSGTLAVSVRLSPTLRITTQVSRGFHDPTLSDRFFRGPVGRGFIVGNPDLAPERSVQVDVIARYDAGRWRASASYYHYDIADLIERYQSGTDTFLFRNRALGQIRGAEIEAAFELGRGVVLNVSAESGRGRAREDGAALDDLAPRSIRLQLGKAIGAGIFVSGRVAAIGRDSAPGPSEVATPGYVEAGATASWRVARQVELRSAASNLLNRRYYSSPSPRGILAPGRSVTLTAVVRF